MLDIGCGTGQLIKPYAPLYARIFGIDVSESQLEQARKINEELTNVSFHYQNSHDMADFFANQMGSEKADFVTFGQSLHWLDHDQIFEGYKEIMNKDGAFAIFSYATCSIMNNEMVETISKQISEGAAEANNFSSEDIYTDADFQANSEFKSFYALIKPHFECNRDDLDYHYAHIDFSKYFSHVEKYLYFDVKKETKLANFISYLKTMSGYRCYLQKYPELEDPLEALTNKFLEIYGLQDIEALQDTSIDVVYPYFLGILKY